MKEIKKTAKAQYKKFLFLIISLVVVCGLFIPFTISNLWWREVLNSSHVILFFFITLALYTLFAVRPLFASTVVTQIAVLVVGLVIGVGIEVFQGFFQREASVDDLLRNFLGILSGLSFVVLTQQKRLRSKIISGVVSLSLLLLGIAPLFQVSWDYLQRDKAFPYITAFEEEWFSRFVRFNDTELVNDAGLGQDDGEKYHQVRFYPGKYSGIKIVELEKDWSIYQKLRFQVYSNNTFSITLVLKIYDKLHNQNYNDRFNQRFNIRPGLNEIVVDLAQIQGAAVSREMDLSNVSAVQLFLLDLESPLFLGLNDLYLEK